MYCTEAYLVKRTRDRVEAITLFCRSWRCPICNPRRKKQLIRDVADGLPTTFLTLTTRRPANGEPVAEARRQAEAFSALILWIRRSHPGKEVQFFAVREATKKGWPHLHVALRMPFVHWKKLRRKWAALTGSNGIDVRAIYNPTKCAKYLAKYIGKDLHQFGTAKRYWRSKRYALEGAEPEETEWHRYTPWEIVREPLNRLALELTSMGWRFERTTYWRFAHVEAFSATRPP